MLIERRQKSMPVWVPVKGRAHAFCPDFAPCMLSKHNADTVQHGGWQSINAFPCCCKFSCERKWRKSHTRVFGRSGRRVCLPPCCQQTTGNEQSSPARSLSLCCKPNREHAENSCVWLPPFFFTIKFTTTKRRSL